MNINHTKVLNSCRNLLLKCFEESIDSTCISATSLGKVRTATAAMASDSGDDFPN